jgi:hypothetical protein
MVYETKTTDSLDLSSLIMTILRPQLRKIGVHYGGNSPRPKLY